MLQNNSQLYLKKEIDLKFQNLLFPLKYHLTTQLSKMLCNNVPLIVQRFEQNALSPEFPGAVSSLKLLEASCLFREYLEFIKFKSCVKHASHYFYCFNGFTNN